MTGVLVLAGVLPLVVHPAKLAGSQARSSIITVTSAASGRSMSAGGVTLLDALEQAANDPRDNVIAFSPGAFDGAAATIRIERTIIVDQSTSGRDQIDASSADVPVTLDVSSCPDAGLIIGGDGSLALRRVHVRGGRQRAILVKQQGELVLEAVSVRGAAGPAVAVFGAGRVQLMRCELAQNRTHGLEVHGRSNAALEYVDLRHNGQSGLAVFDQAAVTASDSRWMSNGDWSLVLTGESHARLARCLMDGARFANADVAGSAGLDLQECTLAGGRRFGVFATGRARVKLVNTSVLGHAGRGVELQDQAELELADTRVAGNEDYGVILFGQSSVRASGSDFTDNGAHGVSVRDVASARFEACAFVGNRYSGVGCLDADSGGHVLVSRCVYRRNGMRPIYRGPLHIAPLVPTPLRVQGERVLCLAEPGAQVELFLDPAGEAARYLRTVQADRDGRFHADLGEVPEGWVMTATSTAGGSTSEFNIIAGTVTDPMLSALLGRTGPLSDSGGGVRPDAMLRRWHRGTHLVFHLPNPPSETVVRYVRFLVSCVDDWTGHALTADVRVGELARVPRGAAVIPVRYVAPDDPRLLGRGGVTFMKWDASGYFMGPMEIILARGQVAQETCPRVLAHEIGHTLGLCHCRAGLLSRMQGANPPGQEFVNDFAPMMTFYDVLALQLLHDPRHDAPTTLRQLVDIPEVPPAHKAVAAGDGRQPDRTSFGPGSRRTPAEPQRSRRP